MTFIWRNIQIRLLAFIISYFIFCYFRMTSTESGLLQIASDKHFVFITPRLYKTFKYSIRDMKDMATQLPDTRYEYVDFNEIVRSKFIFYRIHVFTDGSAQENLLLDKEYYDEVNRYLEIFYDRKSNHGGYVSMMKMNGIYYIAKPAYPAFKFFFQQSKLEKYKMGFAKLVEAINTFPELGEIPRYRGMTFRDFFTEIDTKKLIVIRINTPLIREYEKDGVIFFRIPYTFMIDGPSFFSKIICSRDCEETFKSFFYEKLIETYQENSTDPIYKDALIVSDGCHYVSVQSIHYMLYSINKKMSTSEQDKITADYYTSDKAIFQSISLCETVNDY